MHLENFFEELQGMDAAVVVKDLTKYYGRRAAIEQLNFEIQPGQIVGFLGPNGAGKSTTLRILCGLIPAHSGSVFVDGLSVTTQGSQLKQRIGYMPENNPLPEDMRVEEYLAFKARLKQVPRAALKSCVASVMECCELHPRVAKKMIRALSKGFKQRVGIAEALLGAPKIIVLDEPTIGLDPHQILNIRDLLKNLRGRTTVIFSSHILPEVEVACTHLIILNQGRIVAQGTSQALRQQCFDTARYEVTIHDKDNSFIENLSRAPMKLSCIATYPLAANWTTYVVESGVAEEAKASQLSRWIVENDWPLVGFVKQKPNLEALFLKLTSMPWRQRERLP